MDDAAKIARGLSDAQKRALLSDRTQWRKLIKLDLAYWADKGGRRERIRLRPIGLAVRAHLQEKNDG